MNWKTTSLVLLALVMLSTVLAADVTTDSKQFNATLTLTNTPPSITVVSPDSATHDPIASSTVEVEINFTAYDANGKDDLNDSTASVTIKNGTSTYTNSTCVATDVDAYSKNYTCTFTLQYYDNWGNWNINATIEDVGGPASIYNDSATFYYSKLAAIELINTPVNFGELNLGATDVENENNPLRINNTGNLILNINITGSDLVGMTNAGFSIDVGQVTVDYSGAANATLSTSSQLVNPTDNPIGPTEIGDLEFWIDIPSTGLMSQQYNATWTITGYE